MPQTPEEFVARWSPSGGGERANYSIFLTELCDLIEVSVGDNFTFSRSWRAKSLD